MEPFPKDIFTEPEPDPHTLRNLGPLTPLAGIWEGQRGLDVHPAEDAFWRAASRRRFTNSA